VTRGCFSNGLACLITARQNGREQLLTGGAANLFHHELHFMHMARGVAGSPVSARPWAESLDDLVGRFWPVVPVPAEGAVRV
jgi:hypothetical protein